MKYKKPNIVGALKKSKIFLHTDEDSKLFILSTYNYEILKVYDILKECNLSQFTFASHVYDHKIVLSSSKAIHIDINTKTMEISVHHGPCYPIYEKGNRTVALCRNERQYLGKKITK